MKNHYQILEVSPTASKEEIKAAYIKLSKKMHPDMNNGDAFFTELFKSINEANQVLSNDARRSEFDDRINNIAKELDIIQEKERMLHRKETLLMQRQMRRKLFIRGSVSLFAGLAVIALFSLSFDEKRQLNGTTHFRQVVDDTVPAVVVEESRVSYASAHTVSRELPLKKVFEERKTRTPVTVKEVTTNKAPAKIEQQETPTANRDLTEADMNVVLRLLEHDKISFNNPSKCIRLSKSNNSNVGNAFMLAGFLQSKGYVIAGRETVPDNSVGIRINCNGPIISMTIGLVH